MKNVSISSVSVLRDLLRKLPDHVFEDCEWELRFRLALKFERSQDAGMPDRPPFLVKRKTPEGEISFEPLEVALAAGRLLPQPGEFFAFEVARSNDEDQYTVLTDD